MVANEVLVYKEVPKGKPIPGQTTKKEQQEIDLDAPLEKGSILVRTIALSLDPYMRCVIQFALQAGCGRASSSPLTELRADLRSPFCLFAMTAAA